ncbi:hypothetical protein QBC36DRAFT_336521 [Triangularia setosa]|uniref:Uncharacterized protein n=1 Tax=Triangularia setosa TaxID=2587417 RepID=A0AAN7A3V6_9PEZI|nr:hypothetical protein QBC36DRAFT_336521 [Podospora setosa]
MLPFRAFLSSMLAFSSVAYSAPSSIHNGIISATPSPTNYTIFSCDVPNAKIAEISNIKKGADYLYKRDGKARIGPGPDHCDRVSCSWNSGIFLCNMVGSAHFRCSS